MKRSNRRRLRNCRDKAFAGEAVVAAGIGAAATLAGAAINAASQKQAAQKQADATRVAAQEQANALEMQNQVSIDNQEKQIGFMRSQNERNRDLQKQIQMNLQLLTGQQNENERLEAAKIQLKKGGSARRKLRCAYDEGGTTLLRGNNGNLPFTVTDGGAVIPLYTTPEGYDLYEIVGNDHEHYHKTKGGKNKTGVGIKFINNEVVEGEGNQNSNQGELMLVTPNDAKFISKHSVKGFNPTKAVLAGMHPLVAFNQQEAIKGAYGIDDNIDYSSTPVKKMRNMLASVGGNYIPTDIPDLSLDYLAPTATGVVYGIQNRREAKQGLDLHKGYPTSQKDWNEYILTQEYPTEKKSVYYRRKDNNKPRIEYRGRFEDLANKSRSLRNNGRVKAAKGGWFDDYYWRNPDGSLTDNGVMGVAGGINFAGNALAGILTNITNNQTNRIIQQGNRDATQGYLDTIRKMRGIDLNLIDRNLVRGTHPLVALRNTRVNVNPQLALEERDKQRRLTSIQRNSLSGAAIANRTGRVLADSYDMRSRIYDAANKLSESRIDANISDLNDAAKEAARIDAESNMRRAGYLIDAAKFNANIDNDKIQRTADATANLITSNAQQQANTMNANSAIWSGILSSGANTFSNILQDNVRRDVDFNLATIGKTDDSLENLSRDSSFDYRRRRKLADALFNRWFNSGDRTYINRALALNEYFNNSLW